jgi:hypothetical protein
MNVEPKFFIAALLEKPFSSKYGFKGCSSNAYESMTYKGLTENSKGANHLSGFSKSIQINPYNAL